MHHKSLSGFTIVVMFIVLGLVACAGSEGINADEPAGERNQPENAEIILATTTSTQDSGLLDEMVPVFEQGSGYIVKVIAVGTGQALKMGEEGNADVLLVHAPSAEMVLIDNGNAIDRRLVMHNDFVLVGPAEDPAGIRGIAAPELALKKVAESGSTFVSRGDDSGTNKKELSIWEKVDIVPEGEWYLQSGQGMGATLRIASEKGGYTLTDRATYLAQSKNLALDIVVEGDPGLLNVYHVMMVNPEKWPPVNEDGAQAWSDFLTSAEGQQMIGAFGVETFGQPLFFPDADKSDADLGL